MDKFSSIRRLRVTAGVLFVLAVHSLRAAVHYEPANFVPPPNLVKAMQEAKAKAQNPVLPPDQLALPTPGPRTSTFSYSKSSTGGGATTMALSTLPVAVGRIPATYTVSSTGQAQYSIPIWIPPGARGIEPKLALVYSSAAPDSLMGPGWSLSGLSTISRCPKTLAQDGVAVSVALTSSDKFCLDGNRLRLTSSPGTYGLSGSTYQTEIETFSNVKLLGSGATMYFEVWGKDGLVYEYGNTIDSRVAGTGSSTPYLWALNKVRDRYNNSMTIAYTLSDGAFRPTSIKYTQAPTSPTPHYEVAFTYESRAVAAAKVNQAIGGSWIQQSKVLTALTMTNDSNVVRTYNFGYSYASVTGRVRLTTIQTCSPTDCLKTTDVIYQDGTSGIVSPTTSTGSGSTSGQVNTIDVNADGREDLVYSTVSGANQVWYVRLATASGFGSAISTGLTTASSTGVLFDDLLGNGNLCLLGLQSTTWYVTCWNGSSFPTPVSAGVSLASGNTGAEGEYVTADIDADGRSDLVRRGSDNKVYARLNTSTGSTVTFSSTESLALTPPSGWTLLNLKGNNSKYTSSVRRVDIDGNGADDVLAYMQTSGGTNFYYPLISSAGSTFYLPTGMNLATVDVSPIDFNDDGCSDFIGTYAIGNDRIYVSNCGNLGGQYIDTGVKYSFAADWNSDGRTDIWYVSGGTFRVKLSQGNALDTAFTDTYISSGTGIYRVFDQNGDGLHDLSFADSTAGYALSYSVHNGAGVKPDLATSIVDGFEMKVAFNYKPITTIGPDACYSKDSPSPAYPSRTFMGPLYTACTMTASNGISNDPIAGIYTVTYSYHNAELHLQGRGFLGFARRYELDDRNGVITMNVYGQLFPFIGMQTYSLTRQLGWTINIREFTPTTAQLSFNSGYEARSFPYFSRTDDESYEVGGTLNGQWIKRTRTDTTLDTGSGIPLSVTVETTDKSTASPWYGEFYKVVTTNSITNDTGNWCLGRPTQTTIKSILPDSTSQTRTSSASVDYPKCQNTVETLEPGNSTLEVATTYEFDTCGNISAVKVVGKEAGGSAMIERKTSTNYNARCQFPESVTQTVSGSFSQTSTIAYNYDLGLPSSQTDANGIATSWIYDGYGRKTNETRADGTKTTWTYAACSSSNSYCGVPDLRWTVDESLLDTSGATIRYESNFYDGFDRVRFHEPQNLAGGLDYQKVTYDALGRKARQYEPYTGNWHYHEYTYDLLNRLTADTLYKSGGVFDRITTAAYAGRQIVSTNPKGNSVNKYYDVRGSLRSVVDPSPGGTSYYSWDHFGNLLSTTDAIGTVSSSTYNLRGFKTGSVDADGGTWTYELNSLGEVTGIRDANTASPSWTAVITYDLLGRMIKRVEDEGIQNWVWGTSVPARNIGKLASVTGPGYSETYTYDSKGRLSQTSYSADIAYQVNYAYSSTTGFLDTVTYPTSTSSYRLSVRYCYTNGILSSVKDAANTCSPGGTTWWQLNAQDARGNPIDEEFGNAVHVISQNDDLTGHLNYRMSGNNVDFNNHQNITYEWDKNENLIKRKDVNQSNLTEEFFYDALNRLDYSTRNGTQNLKVILDAAGNITMRSDVCASPPAPCYTYHPTKKHAVTSVVTPGGTNSYGYDANGNMTSRNSVLTKFFSYNLPDTISNGTYSSAFFYGPDRNRWKQVATYTGGSETTIYIGGLMEKVTVPSGTVYRHYIPAGSNTVVYERWSTGANPTYYVTSDHLGSSNTITCGTGVSGCTNGSVLVQESFGAYGSRRGSNWTGSPTSGEMALIANVTRQGFTGHEHLDNLGLIHMNGRVYDPVIGRFMSADPFNDWGQGSQGLNPYSYVSNKMLSFTDPTGFWGDDCTRGTNTIGPNGEPIAVTSYGDRRCNYTPLPPLLDHKTWYCSQFGGAICNEDPYWLFSSGFRGIFSQATSLLGSVSSMFQTSENGLFSKVKSGLTDYIGDVKATWGEWPGNGSLESQLAAFPVSSVTSMEIGAVKSATAVKRSISVLGHHPDYVNVANTIGARYFNVPINVWEKMSHAERWAANSKFLDRMIYRGDEIILATQASAARAGSWFARELEYLSSRGYTLSADGMRMLPPLP